MSRQADYQHPMLDEESTYGQYKAGFQPDSQLYGLFIRLNRQAAEILPSEQRSRELVFIAPPTSQQEVALCAEGRLTVLISPDESRNNKVITISVSAPAGRRRPCHVLFLERAVIERLREDMLVEEERTEVGFLQELFDPETFYQPKMVQLLGAIPRLEGELSERGEMTVCGRIPHCTANIKDLTQTLTTVALIFE